MKPLTIDELKSLEIGDWVWIIYKDTDYRRYAQIQAIEGTRLYVWGRGLAECEMWKYSDYGTKWLAYKNKEMAESKGDLYQIAFELILQDVYENRLKADTLSCSSCPFMEEIFGECQNQGLYEDCKNRWQDYYLTEAERRLAELKGE